MTDQTPPRPHSHTWIDPSEPPIQRAPYSPVIGTRLHEMKEGTKYVCRQCGATCQPDRRTIGAITYDIRKAPQ